MTGGVLADIGDREVGVFRHEDRLFIEAGQAWVPFTIARLDNEYKQRSSEAPLLTRLPSDYIREFYFTTQPFEGHERATDTR